jgi:hypothetical protein
MVDVSPLATRLPDFDPPSWCTNSSSQPRQLEGSPSLPVIHFLIVTVISWLCWESERMITALRHRRVCIGGREVGLSDRFPKNEISPSNGLNFQRSNASKIPFYLPTGESRRGHHREPTHPPPRLPGSRKLSGASHSGTHSPST